MTALREFSRTVAARARGWSKQVLAEAACAQLEQRAAEAAQAVEQGKADFEVQSALASLIKARAEVDGFQKEAEKRDTRGDRESVIFERRYLRKVEVKDKIQSALHKADQAQARIREALPDAIDLLDAKPAGRGATGAAGQESGKTTPRTSVVSASRAKSLGAIVGVTDSDTAPEPSVRSPGSAAWLDLVLEAVAAAVASVVGEESEQHRRILQRIQEELQLRGVNV